MNVTAEHAGGAVVLELDEGCRSVAALRRIISAALHHLSDDGYDVTVQGRAVEDVDVCGLEEGAKIQVVESRRTLALGALRAAGRDVSEGELTRGLVSAIGNRDTALCEQYLDAGCDVNAVDGWTLKAPLHVAASHRFPELCTLLLQRGADVNKSDPQGSTPLHMCGCWSDQQDAYDVREVLLSHGADMHAGGPGQSPLDHARWVRQGVFSRRDRAARRGFKWREQLPPFNALDQYVKYGAPRMRWTNRYAPKGYAGYIQKLVKVQFKRKQQITAKGMKILNAFVTDVFERLAGEAGRVTSFSGAKTLSVRSVVAAVKLQLPEELANHALAAGTASVRRYAKACRKR